MENSKNNSSSEIGEEAKDILPGGVPDTPGADLFQELNNGEHDIKFEIHDVETFGNFLNEDENAAEKLKNEQLVYVEVNEDENLEYTYQLVGAPRETNKENESETETPNNRVDIGVRFLDMIEDSDSGEDDENENVNKDLNQGENCPIGALDINQLLLPNNTSAGVNDGYDNNDNINIESENQDSTIENGSGYSTHNRGMLESLSTEEILEHLDNQAPDNEVTTTTPYYEAIASTSSHAQAAAIASRDMEKSKGSKNTNEDNDAAKIQNQISKRKELKENTDSDCNLVRPVKKRIISKELREHVLRNDDKNNENDEFLGLSDDDSDDIDYIFEDDQNNHSDDSSSEESAIELITRSSIAMKDREQNQKNRKNHHKKAQMGACLSERDYKNHTDAEKAEKKPSSGSKKSLDLAEKKKRIRKLNEHRAMEKEKDIMKIPDAKIEGMRKGLEVLEKRGKATITKKKVKKLDYTVHAEVDYKNDIYICKLCEPQRHFSLFRNFNRHITKRRSFAV